MKQKDMFDENESGETAATAPIVEEKSKPVKVKKPRKPLSEERKEQLRLQLKKARENSQKKRGKTAEIKKMEKEDKEEEIDKKYNELKKKRESKQKPIVPIDEEKEEMRKELNKLKGELLLKQEEKRQVESKPRHERDNNEIKELRDEIKELKEGIKELREERSKPKEERRERDATNEMSDALVPPVANGDLLTDMNNRYRRPKRWLK